MAVLRGQVPHEAGRADLERTGGRRGRGGRGRQPGGRGQRLGNQLTRTERPRLADPHAAGRAEEARRRWRTAPDAAARARDEVARRSRPRPGRRAPRRALWGVARGARGRRRRAWSSRPDDDDSPPPARSRWAPTGESASGPRRGAGRGHVDDGVGHLRRRRRPPALGGCGPATARRRCRRGRRAGAGRRAGLDGEPVHADGYWTVETDDGVARRSTRAAAAPGGTAPEPSEAATSAAPAGGVAGSSGTAGAVRTGRRGRVTELEAARRGRGDLPRPTCRSPTTIRRPPADLPSKDEAREIALDLLAARSARRRRRQGHRRRALRRLVRHRRAPRRRPARVRPQRQRLGRLEGRGPLGRRRLDRARALGDYPIVDTRAAIDRLNAQMGGYGERLRRRAADGERLAVEERPPSPRATIATDDSTTT